MLVTQAFAFGLPGAFVKRADLLLYNSPMLLANPPLFGDKGSEQM
jgi:hypothetical protein